MENKQIPKFDYSTKEGRNAYQRWYLANNKIQNEKQKARNKRNKRNKINAHHCSCNVECQIKKHVGINKLSCKDCEHYH